MAERSGNPSDPKAARMFWVRVLSAELFFCFIFREKQAKKEQSEKKEKGVCVWEKYLQARIEISRDSGVSKSCRAQKVVNSQKNPKR